LRTPGPYSAPNRSSHDEPYANAVRRLPSPTRTTHLGGAGIDARVDAATRSRDSSLARGEVSRFTRNSDDRSIPHPAPQSDSRPGPARSTTMIDGSTDLIVTSQDLSTRHGLHRGSRITSTASNPCPDPAMSTSRKASGSSLGSDSAVSPRHLPISTRNERDSPLAQVVPEPKPFPTSQFVAINKDDHKQRNSSSTKEVSATTEQKTRKKPQRDQHGVLRRSDGRQDMRSVTSVENLRSARAAQAEQYQKSLDELKRQDDQQ